MQSLSVGEVMNPSVITISEEAPLAEALKLMQTNRISALVVVDHAGTMVGILSQTDLLRAWQEGSDYASVMSSPVSQFMTRDVISCAAHKSLDYAMEVLNKHRVHRLVVAETHDIIERAMPIGILSQTDIVRALVKIGAAESERAASEKALEASS
jgi:predicted transcriptional regulator